MPGDSQENSLFGLFTNGWWLAVYLLNCGSKPSAEPSSRFLKIMKSMSQGDNYLQLMKPYDRSMMEPVRWVEEEDQRVVRPIVLSRWQETCWLRAADHSIHLLQYVHWTFIISVVTQLSSTAREKTSELMYDLFFDPWSSHPCLMFDMLSLAHTVYWMLL